MSDSMDTLRSRDRRPWPWRLGAGLVRLGCVAVIGAMCGEMPARAAAAEPPGRTEGKWLVDLGREYSQSAQATGTDNDTEMTLAFMQAASRVEPTLAEAWLWQHGLLLALGRESDAVEAIGKYVERQPEDWLAQSRWITLKTDSLQTLEERLAFWRSRLEATNLPSEVASDLHYRIAEYHYNRRETDAAAKSLDAALTAFPPNLAARQLRVALAGGEPTLSQRMELALAMVRLNPTQPVLLWDVATLLDGEDMDAEAQRWYTHALAAFKRSDPAGSPPAAFLLDMAASQLDAGQTDAADRLARQVLAADG
ncbi:MAG: hypothetical protein JXA69_18020, partial [Phycisphaerae bacterium]|nr:hypothetical protein [Phycisphaerae bacterium]